MIAALAGGALGAGLFLAVFGTGLLGVSTLGWLMRHDLQTYLLAWHHFRREPWQWPLGSIAGVGHPVGTSIGSTDAVPVVAFLLKPWHAWLPDPLQYFGWWLLACFVLQGVFGALLMRVWTGDRRLQVLGACLFVQTPALLVRTGHPALCAHWLLLAALWLSLDGPARPGLRLAAWSLLCAVAAATQPYLAVIVIALGVASAVTSAWPVGDQGSVLRAAASCGALVVVTTGVFWQCGHFLIGDASDFELEGVGFYSMNLLGPVIALGNSMLLPTVAAATPGQYEGYVYFGAGWMALAIAALGLTVAGRGRLPRLGAGWLVVLAFTLLAISPVVTFGSQVLADVNAWAPRQLAVFRSSGRFGWLAMYVAFVMAAGVVVSAWPARTAALVLFGGVALQAADLSGAYRNLHAREHSAAWTTYDTPVKSAAWDVVVPHYRHLVMAPPDMCATVWPMPAGPHLPFSLLAGHHGASINSGNAGRFDVAAVLGYCERLRNDMAAGRLDDDSLYVVSPNVRDELAATPGGAVPLCGTIDGFIVCATESSALSWRDPARAAGFAARPIRGSR